MSVIRKARFAIGPFSSEQMFHIGEATAQSIAGRIHQGLNANDEQAKPLKPGRNGHRGYPDYKAARGLQPIRDWTWTGQTLGALKVKRADENRVVIGFEDERSDTVAHINNVRERMFGIAPSDQKLLSAAVSGTAKEQHNVSVKAA